LAVNLFERDLPDLLQPLAYRQVCPIGFLATVKGAINLLGPSTWSLRLIPWLASLAALAVVASATRYIPNPRAGLIGLALLTVAYHPVQLGSELKPYSTDLLASSIILHRALAWHANPAQPTPLIHLALLSLPLMLVSYPAALVLAAMAAASSLRLRQIPPSSRRAWFEWSGILALSALLVRHLASPQAAAATADPLNEYLHDGFPASLHPHHLGHWLLQLATGRLLAFPFGDPGLTSLAGLGLALVGLATLLRHDRPLATLLAAPFAASLAAGLLRLYPLGGHPRVSQHLLPCLAFILGYGLDRLFACLPVSRLQRPRLAWLILITIGLAPLIRNYAQPFHTPRDQAARHFAQSFWPRFGPDARVLCLRRDLRLFPIEDPNPDVALYLANRSLYAPPARRRPPHSLWLVHYDAPGLAPDDLPTPPNAPPLQLAATHLLPHHGRRGARVRVFQPLAHSLPGTPRPQSLQSTVQR
jgi:hypothetical protein